MSDDHTPTDTRPDAKNHRATTGHDMALVSAAASNCAECDWSAPTETEADDYWFFLPTGALLYGDGTGGATPVGVGMWPEGESKYRALNALAAEVRRLRDENTRHLRAQEAGDE